MTPLSTGRLVALRESRACRLYLTTRLCSYNGNGAHTVAVSALVGQASGGSATVLGGVVTVQYLPQLVGAPVAGALVDRWPRPGHEPPRFLTPSPLPSLQKGPLHDDPYAHH